LTLNIAAGTAICGNPPTKVAYAGGTLTMTNANTNYVFLNPAATCVPGSNITGFTAGTIPLAQVVAAGGVITGVTDVRTWFRDAASERKIIFASDYATLQAATDAAGVGGWLVVDRTYTGLASWVLYRRMRVTGFAPQGYPTGGISFSNTTGSSLIVDAPTNQDYVVLENLPITGPNSGTAIGLDLTNTGIVFLQNVVLRNFYDGIVGSASLSVFLDNCNVSANLRDGVQLNGTSNSWRIRGGLVSQNGRYGINNVGGNDTLIEGVRMESNVTEAIRTNSDATHIIANRFESNGVLIDTAATNTLRAGNYYSTATVTDNSTAQTTTILDEGYLRVKRITAAVNTVTFSATPTFDASLGNTQKITLTANVTSSTLSNATTGQTINFVICQDGSGAHTFVWPTNVKGAVTVGAILSKCSAQNFIFDGTNAYALSAGVINM
jgi:hypothetical protein